MALPRPSPSLKIAPSRNTSSLYSLPIILTPTALLPRVQVNKSKSSIYFPHMLGNCLSLSLPRARRLSNVWRLLLLGGLGRLLGGHVLGRFLTRRTGWTSFPCWVTYADLSSALGILVLGGQLALGSSRWKKAGEIKEVFYF